MMTQKQIDELLESEAILNALNGRGGYYVYVADWILEGAGE